MKKTDSILKKRISPHKLIDWSKFCDCNDPVHGYTYISRDQDIKIEICKICKKIISINT